MTEDLGKGWHLDKRLPIGIIGAILIQSGAAVWWASSVSSRIDTLESSIAQRADQSGRIIRLETQIQGLQLGISRIEQKLDRLIENR